MHSTRRWGHLAGGYAGCLFKSFRFCHLSKTSAFKPLGEWQDVLVAVVYSPELATRKGPTFPLAGALNRGGSRPRGRGSSDPRGPGQGRGRVPSHVGTVPSNCSWELSRQVSVSAPDRVYPRWHWYLTKSPEREHTHARVAVASPDARSARVHCTHTTT